MCVCACFHHEDTVGSELLSWSLRSAVLWAEPGRGAVLPVCFPLTQPMPSQKTLTSGRAQAPLAPHRLLRREHGSWSGKPEQFRPFTRPFLALLLPSLSFGRCIGHQTRCQDLVPTAAGVEGARSSRLWLSVPSFLPSRAEALDQGRGQGGGRHREAAGSAVRRWKSSIPFSTVVSIREENSSVFSMIGGGVNKAVFREYTIPSIN